MAIDYAALCIRETLVKSKGNVTVAQSALVELAKTDERLLLALTQPYLNGIVAHAVGRLIRNVNRQPYVKPETHQSRPVAAAARTSERVRPATVLESVVSDALGGNIAVPVKPISKQTKPVQVSPMPVTLDGLFAQLAKNFEDNGSGERHIPGKASKEHVAALHTIAKHTFRTGEKKK